MIIAAIYPVLLWFLVYKHRRTWKGLAIAAAGTALIWPITALIRLSGAVAVDVYTWLIYAEMVLIGLVSLWLVSMRRYAAGASCPSCRYDLRGLNTTALDARCPECGVPIHTPPAAPGQPCCLNCGQRLSGINAEDADPRCPRCNASQEQFANWKRADSLRQAHGKRVNPG